MPRKSSSSRTSRKSPTKFQGDSTPVNSQPKQTFGSAVTQGVGLGAGVAIGSTMANSAANAIFGNNTSNTSNPSNHNNDNLNENNQNSYTNTFDNFTKVNNCFLEYNDLKKCMVENNGNIEFCKVYQEMLNICRKDIVL